MEKVLTTTPGGKILTNCNVWSPDGEWIVYDTRSDAAGANFDSTRIEMVHAKTGEIRILYESRNGACCGVATWHPQEMRVVFILGPENPTSEWSYGPSRRQGVLVDADAPGIAINLDARDLVSPFTPGALRGGSHVHVFHPQGDWVSFTYDDDVLRGSPRNIGVAVPGKVVVLDAHERNHHGCYYSALATATVTQPRPGSDDIDRACEESWIGARRSLAFQGQVQTADGQKIMEAFVVDLPEDLSTAGSGTKTTLPTPPLQTRQRRLSFTADRRHPGIQGPRHWLRSSPDGLRIGLLMKDDHGVVQLWTVSPSGNEPICLTRARQGIGSAFCWSPDGAWIAAVVDGSVSRIDSATGEVTPLTTGSTALDEIRPEACVISPAGDAVAYVRRRGGVNQICITSAE